MFFILNGHHGLKAGGITHNRIVFIVIRSLGCIVDIGRGGDKGVFTRVFRILRKGDEISRMGWMVPVKSVRHLESSPSKSEVFRLFLGPLVYISDTFVTDEGREHDEGEV